MNPSKTEKSFDTIAYKRRVQAEIYEEIKDLTPDQLVAYFNDYAEKGPFADWWRSLKHDQSDAEAAPADAR